MGTVKNMDKKIIGLLITIIISVVAVSGCIDDETSSCSFDNLDDSRVEVFYPNPTNAYEESVNELSNYATVYEGDTGDPDTLGITYMNENDNGVEYIVIIAKKDPFVVYHEMAHVLNWGWSEDECDWYAYSRTGYWV